MHGNATPNKSWLAILGYNTLQMLGEAACRYVEDGEPPGNSLVFFMTFKA